MQLKNRQLLLKVLAWGLTVTVSIIAIINWGQDLQWRVGRISSYSLFPLFGLLAFSLMWTHYIVAVIRKHMGLDKAVVRGYFEITSFVVLLALLFHPGLLVWQLWRDGFGLPPGSYVQHYVAPGLGWVALLGTVSLGVFLTYELRRLYYQKPWWHYVQSATDVAMLAVFYHGLTLGRQLQDGWLRTVWYFYGLTLVLSLAYIYLNKWRERQNPADNL